MKIGVTRSFYARYIKRPQDVTISLLVLSVTLPITLSVACFLAFFNKGQVIFRQERIGREEEPFTLYKFRTLHADGITPVVGGQWLRNASIDELPQLWNVLMGDMSLVGPRPLFREYLAHYNAKHARRHVVKPGITGLAQVNGRNSLSWTQKFDFDVEYVQTQSWRLDTAILFRTVGVLFQTRAADFHAQGLDPFAGYDEEGAER